MTQVKLSRPGAKSTPFPDRVHVRVVALVALCWAVLAGTSFGAHTKAETGSEPDVPALDAGSLATPKSALRAYDAALPAGGMKLAESAYYCSGDDERKAARAMAEVDLVTSELQSNVKQKFGAQAVEIVLHAARNATVEDLKDAEEKIDGDHATIIWKTNRPPVPMIKVDGKWLVSVSEVLRSFGKDSRPDAFVETCQDVARQLRRTTEEFEAGEYPNVTLLERAIRQRMFSVLGEDR